jgi:hypothetical protein
MPRRNQAFAAVEPATTPSVHAIDPNGVYFVDTFQAIFRLRKSSLRREIRENRLRVSKRCGRYYLLGEWILDWLRDGELRRDG